MHKFNAKLEIIGVNPFVFVPEEILDALFTKSGKNKGTIPIKGKVNGKAYKQTLLRYKGHWRLYINTTMLKNSPKRIGEVVEIIVAHDTADRTVKSHPKFADALKDNKTALAAFEKLSPSRQKEINRYIANLKTEEAIEKNIIRAIGFLNGKGRFVGRDKP